MELRDAKRALELGPGDAKIAGFAGSNRPCAANLQWIALVRCPPRFFPSVPACFVCITGTELDMLMLVVLHTAATWLWECMYKRDNVREMACKGMHGIVR